MYTTRFIHALTILFNCLEDDAEGPMVRYTLFWKQPAADRDLVRDLWVLPEERLNQLIAKVRAPLLSAWLDAVDTDSWDYIQNNSANAIELHIVLERLNAVCYWISQSADLSYRRP